MKPLRSPWSLAVLAALVVTCALSAALVPIVPAGESWPARSPVTDDAYYYLVIARNVGTGHGVTYDGRMANGFHPLYMVLSVLVGTVTSWHPSATPALLVLVGAALYSGLGAWLLARLVRRFTDEGSVAPAVACVVWLLHAHMQRFVLNALETGSALVAWLFAGLVAFGPDGRLERDGAAVRVGAAFGLAFLVRNDSAVLAVAWGLLALARLRGADDGPAQVRRLALAAGVTALVASPWLAFNQVNFHAIMPQSGKAEGPHGLLGRGPAAQWSNVVDAALRNLLGIPVPLPGALGVAGRAAVSALGLAAFAGAAVRVLRGAGDDARRTVSAYALACAMLFVVYGALFGAPWNALRWLAPFTIPGALVMGLAADRAWRDPRGRVAVALGLAVLLGGRVYTWRHDLRNPVPSFTWPIVEEARRDGRGVPTGAFQSGVLSWVEPRVTNLDGKVNPEALTAILAGGIGDYIAASGLPRVIDYRGSVGDVASHPAVRARYELVVLRPAAQPDGEIVMLRRRAR